MEKKRDTELNGGQNLRIHAFRKPFLSIRR